ncbi:HAMP domain-containing sensor histidine kinase [Streptomyces sp. NBC_00343]|uniref:HAMP domain-containing sensor histidine kinase n=1 Tax=Streptomyces sp. NBC_00343 TaxID=2975719 RepID=UPI002E29BC0D|nr:HAMP domain-containing sensor histidine kinase [Streptomyces sp. NBC_00343]
MIRQLIVSYVLLVAVALTAFTVPVAFTLTAQLRGDTEQSVEREAKTMALLLSGDAASRAALDRMVVAYAQETPSTAEVLPASRAKTATHWGDGQLEVTAPAKRDGRTVGAVRITYPTSDLTRRLVQIWGFRAILALAVLAVAAGLGAIVARRLTRPLRQLNDMASKFSDGDLTARSPVTGPHETQTLARTLNQGAERLDTLIASQSIFVADASHQLRTPLTALRLSLDNIADGVDDESVREDVEQATAEVVRMSRLVNGLLVLARAEAKVTAAEPLPLREIVAERLSVWRPAADERGVHIALGGSVVDGRPLVLASPGHLEQVLDNVLSNALEVSPDGATITVRSELRGDEVELTVADEGPGMSDPDKSRAFDRFWRGQGLTGRSGSGLGLAVVRQLVTDDGGTVTLRDAPGNGLSVVITLRASPRSGG